MSFESTKSSGFVLSPLKSVFESTESGVSVLSGCKMTAESMIGVLEAMGEGAKKFCVKGSYFVNEI